MPAIITFITDFGSNSPYVAEMKGAVLTIAPHAQLIDVTHMIPAQDTREAAWVLGQIKDAFPPKTIHVVVVDPGVGSQRAILLIKSANQSFIGPDNGVLTPALTATAEVHNINQPNFWRHNVAATFHGRDIMGPVAAHLANGISREQLSQPYQGSPHCLEPQAATIGEMGIEGEVAHVDSFGNLLTNITTRQLEQIGTGWQIEFRDTALPFVTHYAGVASGTTAALISSSGHLEIAIVNGNAARTLNAIRGETVRVRF